MRFSVMQIDAKLLRNRSIGSFYLPLLYSAATFAPQVIIGSRFSYLLILLLVLIFSFINRARISASNLYLISIFPALLMLQFLLLNDDISESSITSFANLVLWLFILSITPFRSKSFLRAYAVIFTNIMLFASFVGLLQFFSVIDLGLRTHAYNHLIGSSSSFVSAMRMTSFFYEPAAFSYFLTFALFFSLFLQKWPLSIFFFVINIMVASGTGFFLLLLSSLLVIAGF